MTANGRQPSRHQALMSRRALILGAAAVPISLPAGARRPEQFVTHRGWVLRADDLDRLGLR